VFRQCCMLYRLSKFGSFRQGIPVHKMIHDSQMFLNVCGKQIYVFSGAVFPSRFLEEAGLSMIDMSSEIRSVGTEVGCQNRIC
jgi:hypothetical protein